MKNKKHPGSLFGLLARNYLLFTLTLLAIATTLFLLWDHQLAAVYRASDWNGLLADNALRSGGYSQLDPYLTGSGDAFAVYNGQGELIHASAEGFDAWCTPSELACVLQWNSMAEINAYELSDSGPARHLLIRRTYDADGNAASVETMVLDEAYQVVFGGFQNGQSEYTPREYEYLTNTRYPGSWLWAASFSTDEGEPMTLLMRETVTSDSDYYRTYAQSWRIFLLFLPLYLMDTGLFIWWLSRKIGKPLRRLNDAVAAQTADQLVHVGDCGGPREIRRIGESFDRVADRLAASEAERRRLDQGRQKLIADISHDLKTPITVIAGYIDAICDKKIPPEEQERYLKAIQAKAGTLTELIDAFHEYSKVEHPAYALSTERLNLCEYLREYLAGKYDEIDLAGFSLEIGIPESPVFCHLDPMQFRRVLDNLLANALRHNRLGTVLFYDVVPGKSQVTLRIGDNGAGIPPELAGQIFEPFVVGSDARSGRGSGLGLSITRRIVELHGGSIRLSTRPTAGRTTEFLLQLPLAPS